MRKVVAHLSYLFRLAKRTLLCPLRNFLNRHAAATDALVVDIHEKQKQGFVFKGEGIEEKNRVDLANRLNLLKKNYANCLEIGCENGWFGKVLIEKNLTERYLGIEIRTTETARSDNPHWQLLAARAEFLPVKNSRFDLIVALHVLEHVWYPRRLAGELRRVASPNAHFLIAVPLGYDNDPAHRWHFMRPAGWKKYFAKTYGLEPIEEGVFTTMRTEYLGIFGWKKKV